MATEKEAMGSPAGIALIPWDPASPGHADRMKIQRHACGWDADKVPYWQKKVAAGDKLLFWIVLERGDMEDALLLAGRAAGAAEGEPLRDTAAQVGRTTRTATGEAFIPIGHIALDEYPKRNVLFGLPMATLWIKSLYISTAIQSSGLGRKAMAQVETMAAGAPFRSAALALDTTHPEWHRREGSRRLYGTDEPPAGAPPIHTNHAWYARQDYLDMALPEAEKEEACARAEGRESLGYYKNTDPETGLDERIPTTYLYKMI
ncbi:Acyl-CoA N-acyltransferase [Cordyceps fumosorosea ARSEF 2679]|uniref:Acyl-CoA N-acyltransferase n=1 Tax=Cordyceps fumosorosea (strain ARSEF 2679) TaxID=1081104 RepID=A0A162J5J4_CORFA|nr:Acyl-CoA N-acyltransferase [Cordyceps fumosorosea ARSEF 2679]OAA64032.1 Acyl-CoA N-acyltransferase [Cordyceps fumosorosea ARSEF 2679]